MATEKLQVEIVTPNGAVFSKDADEITLPGEKGYFGVLPRHAPLVAVISTGEVRIRPAGSSEKTVFATSGGFAEVSAHKVTVLAEAAESADGIDVARAEAAKERAQKRIGEGRDKWDIERARASLLRAMNRLHIAGN